MWWNTLGLAWREIRRNLLRSFLTVLGIVIGVAAVITMVSIGQGATRAVQQQMASLGTNLLMIRPGQRLGPGRDAGAAPFRESDAQAIAAQVSGVQAVAPQATSGATAVYGARNWSTMVYGSTDAFFQAGNWSLAAGRVFEPAELRAGSSVCVIGATVRSELFADTDPVGARLRLKNLSCEVIGLLQAKGQGGMGQDQDDMVVMPLAAVQRRLTGNLNVNTLLVSMADGADSEQVKHDIGQLLRERRKLAAGDEDNFSVLDTRQLAQALSGTTQVMTTLLGAVAAVSLLVGGIGIMNIMLVSVTERTREIGIRLAIGALGREVLLQFLIEAVVLAALGGLLGVAIASVASLLISSAMGVPYVFDPAINLLAFGFAAVIGVVFGYFPARRAARLDPIEALRHE
jgi:putative ABC transport system permease protein